jgi:hypothetical protein
MISEPYIRSSLDFISVANGSALLFRNAGAAARSRAVAGTASSGAR